MNWLTKIFFIFGLFIFVSVISKEYNEPQITQHPRKYHVRVLLEQVPLNQPKTIKISSMDGFILADPQTKTKTRLPINELIIDIKKRGFIINGTLYHNPVHVYIQKGYLKYNGKEYQGSFLLVPDAANLYVINSIDLEEYVCSVLLTESWPGWPVEVNKAFAIASRSYVIGVILNNQSSKLPYHVRNTNKHQTYTGIHTIPVLKEAVDQTKGIFLAYKNKPIVAMFDACCGGVIPADIAGVNFDHAPYLARNYVCNFCKDCKGYSWKAAYTFDQLEQILCKENKNFKRIKSITITKKDKAGLVLQVSIKTDKKTYTITGKKLYSLIAKIRSYFFDITSSAKGIEIQGRGIGHHLGLCQWGAREMIRQGYDCKEALTFYYPGTHFMKLK